MKVPGPALLAGAIAFLCAGLWLGGHPRDLPSALRDAFVDEQTAVNAEAIDVIRDNYFREVDAGRLDDAALDGMVEELRRRYKDRFSHYFDPRQLDRFDEVTSGHFSGVGLNVSEVKRGLRVARVFPDAPAGRAGIRVGDVIVSVNGRSIAGEDSSIATARIKGPAGTEVRLGVLRPSTDRVRRLVVERARVSIPVVASSLRRAAGERVGYVQLVTFSRGAHEQLNERLERLQRRDVGGIVLDLRGNGGGLLQEAVIIASLFLEDGQRVVSTDARGEGRRVYDAIADPPFGDLPVVILVNRDSASASEILAAALSDHDRATVVGTRTFGKGVFQQVIDLSNGGALDLTVGEYFTPDGDSLADKGFQPQVRAADRPETPADEGLRRALEVLGAEIGR